MTVIDTVHPVEQGSRPQPTVVSGTSPLADGFRSRFFTDADYRRFHDRAPRYDAENAFFAEDFAELVERGYLKAPLPERLGGAGVSLAELVAEQRHLAYWAPATALAVNMHLYWAGSAAEAAARGLADVDWLLDALAAGRVFAAGHGERGNDVGLDDSQVKAVPQPDGSYRITGRKVFTSLSPVWDEIGIHARDDSDPDNPVIVHTFVDRNAKGVRIEETWDALGVRATSSHDTVFEDAIAEAHKTVATHPVGPVYPEYLGALLQWYLPLVSSVYLGIARRALDVAILGAQSRTSLRDGISRHAEKPAVQRQVAQAEIKLEAVSALLDSVTTPGTGDWAPLRPLAAKEFATTTAREVVDVAVQVVGASSVSRRHELERLYRDVRTGSLHPPNTDAVLEALGAVALGQG
ncbi:acyl-CoA/acyl-ACP dehydrogenase [Mycobacterium yunnanensis]|uniref:Acyl-CoA/acyl-ACP dehydrogenase n=1 Tax=Mycobacterium yunnanensis TaxID=368477 RepID=A0A9X2Z8G3_9MYCO|nr:acyl-CoA dehydrogenase family protein [Mycobacterium yunnanensis]MCV7424044.1 acyl-CoA/acyl-ACP dehydrogenase [Mycobacterium yunnanensis]